VEIIIIEHDMEVVFGLADDITVMAQGAVLASGTPGEVGADARVREAYLGHATIGGDEPAATSLVPEEGPRAIGAVQ
jgi:energy-coupling factor transporter ATP-binding protein EcfA2